MGRKSENTEINEIIDSSNNLITESREIADQLNRHFSTIGPNLASKLHESKIDPREYLKQSESKFKLQKVGNKTVLNLLLKMNSSKKKGIDDMSNKILKIAAPVICLN